MGSCGLGVVSAVVHRQVQSHHAVTTVDVGECLHIVAGDCIGLAVPVVAFTSCRAEFRGIRARYNKRLAEVGHKVTVTCDGKGVAGI